MGLSRRRPKILPMTMTMNADAIIALYAARGQLAYEGEGVTQLQHGWQSTRIASRAGAGPALQLAAWLPGCAMWGT